MKTQDLITEEDSLQQAADNVSDGDSMFPIDDGEIKSSSNNSSNNYKVLARKYRPQLFSDLIGQQAMVQTLKHAFEQNRIAQAFILTGIRGTGKTTTARIIAKGLNCTGQTSSDDKTPIDRPTISPCGSCENCVSIVADRHPDVMELDAASRNSINDIRELIELIRYKPVMGRYKIFILDEVHMLSLSAFNGLLKTLEEPPPQVKFIFATTEIRKVPITVLSRCQRFDLRRVSIDDLKQYYGKIAKLEGFESDEDALLMIARAAEGSVRDGLSILDQALALSEKNLKADIVREMLGLMNKDRIYDLVYAIFDREASKALIIFEELYHDGADLLSCLRDIMEIIHQVTKMKLVPDLAKDTNIPEQERLKSNELTQKISMGHLTLAWQILSKGIGEIQEAANTLTAAEMILIRLMLAADLPPPDELLARLKDASINNTGNKTGGANNTDGSSSTKADGGTATASVVDATSGDSAGEIASIKIQSVSEEKIKTNSPIATVAEDDNSNLVSFTQVVELLKQKKELIIANQMENEVHLVAFQKGKIELRLGNNSKASIPGQLKSFLNKWTNDSWSVVISQETGQETIAMQKKEAKTQQIKQAEKDPLIRAVKKYFPSAEVKNVILPESKSEQLNSQEDQNYDNSMRYSQVS